MIQATQTYTDKREKDSTSGSAKRVITSSCLFITAFIFSNLLLQSLTAGFALLLHNQARFSYNAVVMVTAEANHWNRLGIILAYFVPPVFCFFSGALLWLFLLTGASSAWPRVIRLFAFWLGLTLLNMVLTHLWLAPIGSVRNYNNGLYQSFAVLAAWFPVPEIFMKVSAIIAIIVTLGLGLLVRTEIVRYSYSVSLVYTPEGRRIIANQIFTVPVLLGIIPAILLCTKMGYFTTIAEFLNLGIVAAGVFIFIGNSSFMGSKNKKKIKRNVFHRFPFAELAIAFSLWVLVFFLLK